MSKIKVKNPVVELDGDAVREAGAVPVAWVVTRWRLALERDSSARSGSERRADGGGSAC